MSSGYDPKWPDAKYFYMYILENGKIKELKFLTTDKPSYMKRSNKVELHHGFKAIFLPCKDKAYATRKLLEDYKGGTNNGNE